MQDATPHQSVVITVLLCLENNGGGTTYFGVTSNGVNVTGNINATGQYQIHRWYPRYPLTANLSNDSRT